MKIYIYIYIFCHMSQVVIRNVSLKPNHAFIVFDVFFSFLQDFEVQKINREIIHYYRFYKYFNINYQIIQSCASIKYPRQPNFTPSTVPLRMCGTLQIRHASHNNCTKSHRRWRNQQQRPFLRQKLTRTSHPLYMLCVPWRKQSSLTLLFQYVCDFLVYTANCFLAIIKTFIR